MKMSLTNINFLCNWSVSAPFSAHNNVSFPCWILVQSFWRSLNSTHAYNNAFYSNEVMIMWTAMTKFSLCEGSNKYVLTAAWWRVIPQCHRLLDPCSLISKIIKCVLESMAYSKFWCLTKKNPSILMTVVLSYKILGVIVRQQKLSDTIIYKNNQEMHLSLKLYKFLIK